MFSCYSLNLCCIYSYTLYFIPNFIDFCLLSYFCDLSCQRFVYFSPHFFKEPNFVFVSPLYCVIFLSLNFCFYTYFYTYYFPVPFLKQLH